KAFKRDYVRVNPIPTAAAALPWIDAWVGDYGVVHQHSGLGYRSLIFLRFCRTPMLGFRTARITGFLRSRWAGLGLRLAFCAQAAIVCWVFGSPPREASGIGITRVRFAP